VDADAAPVGGVEKPRPSLFRRARRVAADRGRRALTWGHARLAELLLAAAGITGWTLLTWGLARLLVPEVWLISGGLFFLALFGFGPLKELAADGLYVLTRPEKKTRG
jgi:hypothetical protein